VSPWVGSHLYGQVGSRKQPNTYFEETVVHLFRTCSYRVKELGQLSLKSWVTEILMHHELSLEGIYSWFSGLGKKSHWQLLHGERKCVFKKAKSLGVPHTRVLGANSGPHIHPGDVLSVNERMKCTIVLPNRTQILFAMVFLTISCQ